MTWLLANIRLVVSAIAILAAFISGWYIRDNICDTALAKANQAALQQALDDTARYNVIAAELEITKAEKQKVKTVIRERIRNANDPSFGCHVTPDGLSVINDARGSGNTSKPNQ